MKKWYFLILSTILLCSTAFSSNPYSNYKFHTVFVYNFVKYVEWPQAPKDKVIAICSDNPMIVEEFLKMARYKTRPENKIIIKSFTSSEELPNAHAIFVPAMQESTIPMIKKKIKNKSVLLITEGEGNLEKGSGINMVMHKGRLNFEIDKNALENHDLKISRRLLSLAHRVIS